MVEISASVLAADLASLRSEITTVETADRLHVDIMDGHFVPNISLGFPIAERIAACTDLPIDIHLMVTNPEQHLERLTQINIRSVTFHTEVTDDAATLCQRLRNEGIVPGIAVNPDTEIETVASVADAADRVTLMGVHPGFSGQSFMSDTVKRIETVGEMSPNQIEVDGGVDTTVSQACIDAGADILVSGSTIFHSSNRNDYIQKLRSVE